jgi:hypothetical protein
MMKKAITGVATAAVLAGAVVMPSQAEARWGHRGWGWGPGIVGGLAAGALIGGALAGPRYYGGYYGSGPYYGYARAYDCPPRRVWTPYGWRWRRVCY